jgi:AcrR family transcriptional regulator
MANMSSGEKKKYRESKKREQTRIYNEAAIENAAWSIFRTVGFEAANIRDIVNLSGVSPGTFYNYYKTKDKIFNVISERLLEKIALATKNARAQASSSKEMLERGLEAYLNAILEVDGALEFLARNQHHFRMEVFKSPAIASLLFDLSNDYKKFFSNHELSDDEFKLLASITISIGAETVFTALRSAETPKLGLASFLAKLLYAGIEGWRR